MRPLAIAALLALPLAARADPVGFTFSFNLDQATYSTTWGPGPVFLDVQVAPDGSGFSINHGSATAAFTAVPGAGVTVDNPGGGSSANVSLGPVTFTAQPGGPAFHFGFLAELTGKLHITDTASGDEADLAVSLGFSGSVGPLGDSYSIAVIGPPFPGVPIGGHDYTAGYAPLAFGSGGAGLLADVFVDWPRYQGPIPDYTPVPEPSALLLGAAGLLGMAWRVRRREGEAPAEPPSMPEGPA